MASTNDPAAPNLITRRQHLVALPLILSGMLVWTQRAIPAETDKTGATKAQASHHGPPPAWKTLTLAQQEALAPLAPIWGSISSNRKRKWIALSANFNTMSPTDKATLHGRMKEWASLSTAERNRARLSFAQTQDLSHAEKKAQWEAYQSLSPERKKQLAASAGAPATGAAPAVTRSSGSKLAPVPTTRSSPVTPSAAARRAMSGASAALPSPP